MDEIYENHITNSYGEFWSLCTIYNNIIISIEINPYDRNITFIYIPNQINQDDLTMLKQKFSFLINNFLKKFII
jgi:hypothetical protein